MISLAYSRKAGGTRKQRRATITRRMQAHRKWWKREGKQNFIPALLSGQGGGIFGVTVVSEAAP